MCFSVFPILSADSVCQQCVFVFVKKTSAKSGSGIDPDPFLGHRAASTPWQTANQLRLVVEIPIIYMCHGQGCRYIGDGKNPTFNRNPYNWYIKPYYWVDDHPLLYGNNGSLDPSTYGFYISQVVGFLGFLVAINRTPY